MLLLFWLQKLGWDGNKNKGAVGSYEIEMVVGCCLGWSVAFSRAFFGQLETAEYLNFTN